MFSHHRLRNALLYIAVASLVFVAGFFKIADLDFWWHLKTGQLILQQRAVPHTDIYSFTAFGHEYIDHEWLFQVFQYLSYSLGGAAGVILLKCVVLILIYLLLARFLLQQNHDSTLVAALLLLSICGARARFIERPEIFTALFLVGSYILIDKYLRSGNLRILVPIPFIIVLWANIHAAVILGIVLQVTFLAGMAIDATLVRQNYPVTYHVRPRDFIVIIILLISSLLVASINPNGFRTLKVPFELTAIIDSGLLKNQEWQQPPITRLPLFYASLILVFVLAAVSSRKLHFVNFLLSAFFAYISLKYIRNIGLFCMMMPIFVAPYIDRLRRVISPLIAVIVLLAALCLMIVYSPFQVGIGRASYFPEKIVEFTTQHNLQGHMLNSYGFGGYLIWRLYPERKIFIDGRNEVYLSLLKEILAARADSRKWRHLVNGYAIEYALLNYVDDLEVVTVVDRTGHVTTAHAPFSSTHFPRKDWALVYWDDTGMVMIRRNGVNRALTSLEYTSVFPEGRYYQESLIHSGAVDEKRAREELQRKLREEPGCARAQSMLQALGAGG